MPPTTETTTETTTDAGDEVRLADGRVARLRGPDPSADRRIDL